MKNFKQNHGTFFAIVLAAVVAMMVLFATPMAPLTRLNRGLRRLFRGMEDAYWASRLFSAGIPRMAGGADPYVRQARGVFTGTVGSTAVVAGDAFYFDGTDWELADADDHTKFAEAIAVNSYNSGDVGAFCRSCLIVDIDAPYSQGDQYFLSGTAGAITATRPTGANNLKQVLGFGLSTTELYIDIAPVKELAVNLAGINDGTAANVQTTDYTGVLLAATSEAVGYTCMVPENAVALEIAYLWWAGTGTALDTADTYTIDVSSGADDETTSATQDGITAASLAVAANDLNRADVSAAFDVSGIIEPGNVMGIDVDKSAEGTTGDDPLMLNCTLVFLVV